MGYGASGAEWAHFSLILGLTEDLLPVVSNPTAKISADSQLKALGKVPSKYYSDRATDERVAGGIKKWTQVHTTSAQVSQYAKEEDYGISIQTRNVRALDVDVDDAAEANRLRRLIYVRLGRLPIRRRTDSSRFLIAFRMVGEPMGVPKRVIKLETGLVELLADGQQFIAAGMHPKGGRYFWEGGLPDDIPEVPRETIDALWQEMGGAIPQVREKVSHLAVARPEALAEDPVVQWLEHRGWIREIGRESQVNIWCPWAMDHTDDSGPTETAYWPAGTGGYACGHFKCLHAHCAERSDEDFLKAIGFEQSRAEDFSDIDTGALVDTVRPKQAVQVSAAVANGRAPAEWYGEAPGMGLKKKRNRWVAELPNVMRALDTVDFWRKLGWDEFRADIVHCSWTDEPGKEGWIPIEDNDFLVQGRVALQQAGFEPVGPDLMRDAVGRVARGRRFDSAKRWLSGLKWDGIPRVERFLIDYAGAADTPYVRAVGLYMWTALAGRLGCPGIQADMVVIFVGPQGQGKTRGIEALAPFLELYVTVDLGMRDAELARRTRGKSVVELAELSGLHTRDRTKIKSYLTERADSWRQLYQERETYYPRRFVPFGSTNDMEILDDETGNRRFLPVLTGRLDVARITRDREQLWAEGQVLYGASGVLWGAAQTLAVDEHAQFEFTDSWTEEVCRWLSAREVCAPFTLAQLAEGLGHDVRMGNRARDMRLAKILRTLKYAKCRRRIGGMQPVLWSLNN